MLKKPFGPFRMREVVSVVPEGLDSCGSVNTGPVGRPPGIMNADYSLPSHRLCFFRQAQHVAGRPWHKPPPNQTSFKFKACFGMLHHAHLLQGAAAAAGALFQMFSGVNDDISDNNWLLKCQWWCVDLMIMDFWSFSARPCVALDGQTAEEDGERKQILAGSGPEELQAVTVMEHKGGPEAPQPRS